MDIFVVKYTHRHGEDVSVFATAQGAEEYRQSIAAEWWDSEIGEAKPEDAAQCADEYFARMEELEREWFSVEAQRLGA